METNKVLNFIQAVIDNMPSDWLSLTTHRLDIYNEKLAKTEFLRAFASLFKNEQFDRPALKELPTAYDYIRLGHPLSCILEWSIAELNQMEAESVISFGSETAPILAILRKNHFLQKNTLIAYSGQLPTYFDTEVVREVYGYTFELQKVNDVNDVPEFEGSCVYVSQAAEIGDTAISNNIDFTIALYGALGSIIYVNGEKNKSYVSDIQHVRRRETVAMTPSDCLEALKSMVRKTPLIELDNQVAKNKASVLETIKEVTGSPSKALVASSGLSIQYAILMGLIHEAQENQKGKPIKIIVPPNCYGGTNDQARRVASCLDHVDIIDLLVDGDNDMVESIDSVLAKVAQEDAVAFIIAEIPTNPRVEVPDLQKLKAVLSQERKTATGTKAIDPVFILDQTFCPNVQFLGEGHTLSEIRTISFASGSKFPSGGKCTAGYCVGNKKTLAIMEKIELHLALCDNEAKGLQYEILAQQMPSMNQRIEDAYANTRDFVNYIHGELPGAKINFVSETLAEQGFTPSVFSLDLPTKGDTEIEREAYKRALNLKLINMMIGEIPDESKYCVSYGQLRGCYWTVPATSTQGTTKEGDKDYIARVALSPDMDLEKHKKVFSDFVASI